LIRRRQLEEARLAVSATMKGEGLLEARSSAAAWPQRAADAANGEQAGTVIQSLTKIVRAKAIA
jgi:hypothetical protein